MKLSRILASLAIVATLGFSADYSLDQSHTSVGFKIKHLMISNVYGSFGLFDGDIKYDKKSKLITAINAEIDASSIDTDNEKRDDHLRSSDFFDSDKYESILFKSTKIEGDGLYADLTIRDITKNVKFEIEDLADIVGPKGNHRIGFTLKAKIDRRDFGLTWSKLLETGGLMVGNDVKIIAEIQAIEK